MTMQTYKNRQLKSGQRVRVHRNLNRGGYSVISWEGSSKGLVVAHCKEMALHNVKFIVQRSGWKRFWDTGTKNVHAFIEGRYMAWEQIPVLTPKGWHDGRCYRTSDPIRHWAKVDYNPMLRASFVIQDKRRKTIKVADTAILREFDIRAAGCIQ